MSHGDFQGLPTPAHNDPRRASTGQQATYDAPMAFAGRRRTLSPGPSSRRYVPYDDYPPSRAGPPLPEYANSYRPDSNTYRPESNTYRPDSNNYRPEINSYRPAPNVYRPGRTYLSRSPSPDRYESPHRPEVDAWGRAVSWSAPSAAWTERNSLPSRTPLMPEPQGRRDIMAERMFEPSDSWKDGHLDRPAPVEVTPPKDRPVNFRRDPMDDRLLRSHYSPPFYPPVFGERYRPVYPDSPPRQKSYLPPRGDSWRPNDDDGFADPSAMERRYVRDSPPRREPSGLLPRGSPGTFPNVYRPDPGPEYERYLSRTHGSTYIDEAERHFTPLRSGSPTATSTRHPSETRMEPFRQSTSKATASKHTPSITPPFRTKSPVHSSPHSMKPPTISANATGPSPRNESPHDRPFDADESPRKKIRLQSPSLPSQHTIAPSTSSLEVERLVTDEVVDKDHASGRTNVDKLSNPPVTRGSPKPPSNIREVSTDLDAPNSRRVNSSSIASLSDSTPTPTATAPVIGQALNDDTVSKKHSGSAPDSSEHSTGTTSAGDKGSLQQRSPVVDNKPLTSSPRGDARSMDVDDPPSAPVIALAPPVLESQQESPQLDAELDMAEDSMSVDPPVAPGHQHIPNMADAKSTADALRIVVMTRMHCDRQTYNHRVDPVLEDNIRIAPCVLPPDEPCATQLVEEVIKGKPFRDSCEAFASARSRVAVQLRMQNDNLAAKVNRLRREYLDRHEKWQTYCARLDGGKDKKSLTPEETVPTPASGRTTRRSAAALGDAVPDFELDQVIASLGNDELFDPEQLAKRNVAKIPDMISVTEGSTHCRFDDTNNIVDDPHTFYAPDTGIDDWTETEKELFVEHFATYPKQFGLIADHIPHKTASQCVAYYYLHKKQFIDFRKLANRVAPGKRKGKRKAAAGKQKGNALLTDIRQHDDEVSASSGPVARRKRAPPRRGGVAQLEGTPTSTPTPEPEARQKRTRRAAQTASVADRGQEDGTPDAEQSKAPVKRGRKARRPTKTPATVSASMSPGPAPDQDPAETISRRKLAAAAAAHWSDEDKKIFLALLAQHGDDFKRIAASMPNKTTVQVSNYYKSNLSELELEKVAASAPKRSPTPEAPIDAPIEWKELPQYPGSGVMSPIVQSGPSVSAAPTAGHSQVAQSSTYSTNLM